MHTQALQGQGHITVQVWFLNDDIMITLVAYSDNDFEEKTIILDGASSIFGQNITCIHVHVYSIQYTVYSIQL